MYTVKLGMNLMDSIIHLFVIFGTKLPSPHFHVFVWKTFNFIKIKLFIELHIVFN